MSAARRDRPPAGRGDAARISATRLAAVQAVYQMQMPGQSADRVLEEFLRHRMDSSVEIDDEEEAVRPKRTLFAELTRGVMAREAELDEMIAAALPAQWSVERLERVLRAILRCGAYELLARANVPARAAINEYVDLAHAFYSGPEPGMVNAILDRLARTLRPAEFEATRRDRQPQAG